MGSLIPQAPLVPPPSYERGQPDSDASSITSLAPSYVSDRPPSYDRREANGTALAGSPSAGAYAVPALSINVDAPSIQQAPQQGEQRPVQYHGLPPLRYAPGFNPHITNTCGSGVPVVAAVAERSHAARQYRNVAARRHSGHIPTYPSPLPAPPAAAPPPEQLQQPVDPREDPALVGTHAASLARARRQYRESCAREGRHRRGNVEDDEEAGAEAEVEEMRRREAAGWDFMLAQMADWEGREREWAVFRREVGTARRKAGSGLLGREGWGRGALRGLLGV